MFDFAVSVQWDGADLYLRQVHALVLAEGRECSLGAGTELGGHGDGLVAEHAAHE